MNTRLHNVISTFIINLIVVVIIIGITTGGGLKV